MTTTHRSWWSLLLLVTLATTIPAQAQWALPSVYPLNTVLTNLTGLTFPFTCVVAPQTSWQVTVPTAFKLSFTPPIGSQDCKNIGELVNPSMGPTTPSSKTSLTINATIILSPSCNGVTLTPSISFPSPVISSWYIGIPTNLRTWTFYGPSTITGVTASTTYILAGSTVSLTITGTSLPQSGVSVTIGGVQLPLCTLAAQKLVCTYKVPINVQTPQLPIAVSYSGLKPTWTPGVNSNVEVVSLNSISQSGEYPCGACPYSVCYGICTVTLHGVNFPLSSASLILGGYASSSSCNAGNSTQIVCPFALQGVLNEASVTLHFSAFSILCQPNCYLTSAQMGGL